MKRTNTFLSRLSLMLLLLTVAFLTSCGTYYNASAEDGIYDDGVRHERAKRVAVVEKEVIIKEKPVKHKAKANSFYQEYFRNKAEAYADIDEEDIVTDVDDYYYEDEEGSYDTTESNVYIHHVYDYYPYYGYAYRPWYRPYYGFSIGFHLGPFYYDSWGYDPYWDYGYYGPTWGSLYYGPSYGYYNGYYGYPYYNAYYGNGYYNGYYGHNYYTNKSYVRGRRSVFSGREARRRGERSISRTKEYTSGRGNATGSARGERRREIKRGNANLGKIRGDTGKEIKTRDHRRKDTHISKSTENNLFGTDRKEPKRIERTRNNATGDRRVRTNRKVRRTSRSSDYNRNSRVRRSGSRSNSSGTTRVRRSSHSSRSYSAPRRNSSYSGRSSRNSYSGSRGRSSSSRFSRGSSSRGSSSRSSRRR